jgi:putative membrane protein
MRIITVISSFLIIVLGVTFAFLNAEPVVVNYYVGTSQMPLSILLVSILGMGTLLGLLIGFIPMIKLKFSNRRLRKRLEHIEHEISQLRVLAKDKV